MEQRVVGRRWVVYSSASGTVMIAGGAFWLSFVALADLARRSGIERLLHAGNPPADPSEEGETPAE